jgi:TonB-dependent receptor
MGIIMKKLCGIGFNLSAKLLASSMLASVALAPVAIAGTVSGEVVDASGTRTLRGATVSIVELGLTAQVESDGSFRFANLPAGSYTLRVQYPGAVEQSRSIEVSETGEITENFSLASRSYSEDDAVVDTILVIGQRANLLSSIARQRASDTVETVLTRDAIGQFPDQNVAEALRRAPGINVLNDQGEGRFVSVRGLDPNLNSASINGNRILATGGDERAVALDVIPSELIESIEIKKSLTPDMDGDTIGGSIEINTTSAFDRKKDFFSASIEGSYNDLNGKTSPKGSVDFIRLFGDRLGVAGGFSYYDREFSTDNIEADGWSEADDGTVYAEDLEYRDYDVRRERYGLTLGVDFRLNETTDLYARGLYSSFDDTELRRRLVFGLSEQPTSGTDTTASFDSADGRIQVRRDLKDRGEAQTITTYAAGGKTETGPWKFTYDAAYSEADQTEDGSIDPIRFQARFQTPGALGVTFDYADLERPGFNIDFGQAAFLDPASFGFTLLERTTEERAKDKESSLKGDIAREFALSNGTFEVKAGAKLRQREKSLDLVIDLFEDFDGDLTLADVVGQPSYGLADISPLPSLGSVRSFVGSNIALFELNQLETDFVSNAESYRAEEDILAGYLMGKLEMNELRLIGGVRIEQTKTNTRGNRTVIVEEGALVNGVPLDDDTLFLTPVSFENEYTDVLPSLNLRYDVSDKIVARAGAFQSLIRPNFGSFAPRFIIEENEDNERSGEFGNPDLDPYRATNFDATIEYYFSPESVIQAGVFYKKIDDFIVNAEFENGVFAGIAYDEAVIPINGDEAEVRGFEFAYGQAFTMLPAPFDGLLANVNYTYTDAEGDVLGRTVPLPTSSKHTYNLVLGYEKGPVSLRLSGAGRSSYLDDLGGDAESDRYVKSHFQVDASAKYRINPNFQVFAELVNLNDATYTAYQRGPIRDRLLQYEEYSWTAKFGLKANY